MADDAPEREGSEEPDSEGSEEERKRKFREALERKRAKQTDANAARGGKDAGKVHGAHGPAQNRRSFRRKTGGWTERGALSSRWTITKYVQQRVLSQTLEPPEVLATKATPSGFDLDKVGSAAASQ